MSINTQKIKTVDSKSFKYSKLKTEDFSHRAETREEVEKKEKEFEEEYKKRTRTRERKKKSKKMTTTVV